MNFLIRSNPVNRLKKGRELLGALARLPSALKRTSVSGKIRKIFEHKFTILVVPHNALSRFHFQFSFSFFIFFIGFSVGLFAWAAWAVTSNIDYWSLRANHEVLKLKVQYFAAELRKNREMLDDVRGADIQIRKLLKINNRQKILDGDLMEKSDGQGGPEPFESALLEKALNHALWTITESEIRQESQVIRKESEERLASFKEISQFIGYERGYSRSCPLGWPSYGRLTSHYGFRIHPLRGRGSEFHMGIDIANEGGTPVRSTADGVVRAAHWEGGYGRLVIIDHGFGFRTYYGHNHKITVKPGQYVRRGEEIALMGSTGSSTGNHSHYEVWQYGKAVDPWKFASAPLPIRSGDRVRVAKKVRLGSEVGMEVQ